MSKRQVTLADIARELNISTATVSRALKDYPDISAQTKERVLALAKKLHYRPNSLAAGLRKKESKVLGVIIPEIVNHFFSAVIKGIMEVAYEADYRVMLCQSDESYEKEVADAQTLLASQVDGLLVSLAHETKAFEHFLEFQHAGVPIVLFDKVTDQINSAKIVVDDYAGAYNAVKHLIEQGKKRIAHFSGPSIASTSFNRMKGYKDALQDHNLPLSESYLRHCEKITLEEGVTFAEEMLALPEPPDAIFAITDAVAIGALTLLKRKGIRIPEDIAVAGFSDWKISTVIEPSLTTVAQPSYQMGRLAAERLIEEISASRNDQSLSPETIVLKSELKIRNSTLITKVS